MRQLFDGARQMRLEDFLIQEEGDDSRHLANGDVASTWDFLGHVFNIGPGLTHNVTASTVWTPAQLAAAEAAEFAATRAAVASLVKVPLTENQRTALESLTYNIGVHGFATSTVLRDVNRQDFADVPQAMLAWNRAGGCVCKGLIKRRNDEIRLFELPDSATASADLKTPKFAPIATNTGGGFDTKGLQLALNELIGSKLTVDGVFGIQTVVALRSYQRGDGLVPDGICGPLTTQKLQSAIAALPSANVPASPPLPPVAA